MHVTARNRPLLAGYLSLMCSPHAPRSCRRFHADHAAWVDGELPEADALAMRAHAAACGDCQALDTQVRRALLVVRNARPLTLSAGFHDALAARLAAERATRPAVAERHRLPTRRTVAALAASLVAMAWLANHRPAVGLPATEHGTVLVQGEIPPAPMPQPLVVRTAPLRNVGAVRVVSVEPGTLAAWSPAATWEAPAGASLVPVSASVLATR